MDSRQEKLSATQWSWMRDPEGFEKRMQERANRLHQDGYFLEPGKETGVFDVMRYDSRAEAFVRHTVNVLTGTCTCPFATKAEVPCKCKHLLGAMTLAEAMLVQLTQAEAYCKKKGELKFAMERFKARQDIVEAVNAVQDALMVKQYEEQEAGRAMCEADAIDGELRGSYGVEF